MSHKDPEQRKKYNRDYYQKYRKVLLERQKKRNQQPKIRQKKIEYYKQYYQNHRAEKLQYGKEWRKNNPAKANEYRRKYYRQWLEILKTINGKIECASCGYNKKFAAIDGHHNDPTKKEYSLSYFFMRKPTSERLIHFRTELEKCTLLCKTCHYEITFPDAL